MEPHIHFCTSADGTRITYAAVGEGPPLLVVPGWGHNVELDWKQRGGHEFFESLSQGRMVASLERRGAGASQWEVDDLSLEAQAADLAADHSSITQHRSVNWREE
jgi:pimeloyl-ACP methyl ester carboxylesterase